MLIRCHRNSRQDADRTPALWCKSFEQLDDHPCHCFCQAASTRASSSQTCQVVSQVIVRLFHWLQSGYCCFTANLSVRIPLLLKCEAPFSTYCHPATCCVDCLQGCKSCCVIAQRMLPSRLQLVDQSESTHSLAVIPCLILEACWICSHLLLCYLPPANHQELPKGWSICQEKLYPHIQHNFLDMLAN